MPAYQRQAGYACKTAVKIVVNQI